MKKSLNCLFAGVLVSATVGLSTLANARETNAYIGINYTIIEQEPDFASEEFDTGDLSIRFGGDISEYFSSELRLGATVKSAEDKVSGVEFMHDFSIGGLLRLRKEMGPITPYVGVGYMWTKARLSGVGSSTEGDIAAAAGLDISLGEKLGLNVEYFALTLESVGDTNRSGPSAGLFWRF